MVFGISAIVPNTKIAYQEPGARTGPASGAVSASGRGRGSVRRRDTRGSFGERPPRLCVRRSVRGTATIVVFFPSDLDSR
jgi:hypothetical protein